MLDVDVATSHLAPWGIEGYKGKGNAAHLSARRCFCIRQQSLPGVGEWEECGERAHR